MTSRPKTMSPDGHSHGEAALAETLRRILMTEAFPGQTGVGTVKILDADGRETEDWDMSGGIQYESSDSAVASIVDEDLNPKDATVAAHALGTATLTAKFDGRVGPDENMITLQAIVDVVQPPPGAAVGGTFEVVWEQVPTP
jgi:hypothetical protein